MKRFAFRLAVALSTLALGLTITGVVGHRQQTAPESPASPLTTAPEAVKEQLPRVTEPQENNIDFEAGYVGGDKLMYGDYEVERTVDREEEISTATIKRNGHLVATFSNGRLGKEATAFGVFPLLGQETNQLVIKQYTGGAHCCWIYKVYDSHPKLHLIFDDEYAGTNDLGYELHAEDIDGDGRYELIRSVMTFEYFFRIYSSSVWPTAVLSYDDKSRAYVPANPKFSRYLLRELHDNLKELDSAKANVDPENLGTNDGYRSAVLQVLLDYLYAGERENGWKFFNHEYRLSNKDKLRNDIEQALRSDPIYKSIYRY